MWGVQYLNKGEYFAGRTDDVENIWYTSRLEYMEHVRDEDVGSRLAIRRYLNDTCIV